MSFAMRANWNPGAKSTPNPIDIGRLAPAFLSHYRAYGFLDGGSASEGSSSRVVGRSKRDEVTIGAVR